MWKRWLGYVAFGLLAAVLTWLWMLWVWPVEATHPLYVGTPTYP
ncbi:MAG: hypothetical protein Kow0047_19600 [Anaerolineae bacterium]